MLTVESGWHPWKFVWPLTSNWPIHRCARPFGPPVNYHRINVVVHMQIYFMNLKLEILLTFGRNKLHFVVNMHHFVHHACVGIRLPLNCIRVLHAFWGIPLPVLVLNFCAQFHIERIPFQAGHEVETLEEAKAAIQKLITKGSRVNLIYRGWDLPWRFVFVFIMEKLGVLFNSCSQV